MGSRSRRSSPARRSMRNAPKTIASVRTLDRSASGVIGLLAHLVTYTGITRAANPENYGYAVADIFCICGAKWGSLTPRAQLLMPCAPGASEMGTRVALVLAKTTYTTRYVWRPRNILVTFAIARPSRHAEF